MTEPPPALRRVAFGPFLLDADAASLSRDGVRVSLAPRAFAVLCHLVEKPGRLVTKASLLDAVWGHRHVSDSVLKSVISTLRTALDDDARAPRWIETEARRGYRFMPGGTGGAVGAPAAGGAAASDVAVVAGGGAGGGAGARPMAGNLPPAAPALIGRAADLATLDGLLGAHRLVTLAGSGGVGKTRLALAAAAQTRRAAADGVWLVRLDALDDGQALVATIARSLALSPDAARSAEALAAALASLSLLLVLDNCEHLIDEVAPLVQHLLSAAPRLRVLVTSQEPLHVAGEQLMRLAPLALSAPGDAPPGALCAAVLLFAQRVQARLPAFEVDDGNRQAVDDLCRALDGLPLALELAAARVPLLGADGVLARLRDRLALLTQGARDAAPRHRTLRDALAWSHGLLSATEQAVLRRLAVFAGSFSLEAAQAVAADEGGAPMPDGTPAPGGLDRWAVLDALGALVDKSLLVMVSLPAVRGAARAGRRRGEVGSPLGGAAPGQPEGRLRLFDSIRSFAAEQLHAAGEQPATRQRHALWVHQLLESAGHDVHDMMTLEWTARLLPDVDNLRAALRHAVRGDGGAALAVDLFARSMVFWVRAGLKHEALRWHGVVRPLVSDALPAALRANFGQAQAMLSVYGKLLPPADARPAIELALRLHRAEGDALNEYFDLYLLSHLMLRTEPGAGRLDLWHRMVALEGPDWGLLRRRYSRWLPAQMLRDEGNAEGYRQFCVDELARLRTVNDRNGIWVTTYALALAEHDFGRTGAAIALLDATVQDIRAAGCLREQPSIVALHASMLLASGLPARHLAPVREAVALLRADGTLWWMGTALCWAPLWAGRWADAARVMGWADQMIERRGERPGPFFARLRTGCETRLLAEMGAATLAGLRAEGALLEEEAALRLALG